MDYASDSAHDKQQPAYMIQVNVREVDPRWIEARVPKHERINAFAIPEGAEDPVPVTFETYPPMTVTSSFGKVRLFVRKDDRWFIEALLPIASREGRAYVSELRRVVASDVLAAVEEELKCRFFDQDGLRHAAMGLEHVARQLAVHWESGVLMEHRASERGDY